MCVAQFVIPCPFPALPPSCVWRLGSLPPLRSSPPLPPFSACWRVRWALPQAVAPHLDARRSPWRHGVATTGQPWATLVVGTTATQVHPMTLALTPWMPACSSSTVRIRAFALKGRCVARWGFRTRHMMQPCFAAQCTRDSLCGPMHECPHAAICATPCCIFPRLVSSGQ